MRAREFLRSMVAVELASLPLMAGEGGGLADRLVRLLKENYDRKPILSFGDAILHRLGRSAYFQALESWLEHRGRIDEAPVPRNAAVGHLLAAVEPCLSPEEFGAFRKSFEQLFRISLRNFEMYHAAVLESHPGWERSLTSADVDRCLDTPKYRRMQDLIYEEEGRIRLAIRQVLADPCVRRRAGVYAWAYEFLDRQRERTIARLRGRRMSSVRSG